MSQRLRQKRLEKVPEIREYESEADGELDQALVNAIEKAEAAGNTYLATVLENELGSHYYSNKE